MNWKMTIGAIAIGTCVGLCGCKGGGDAEAEPAAEETAAKCEKCPEGECKCEAPATETAECTKCEGECSCEG